MEINELTGVIVNLCIKIHTRINPGYFERVYEEILYYELQRLKYCSTKATDVTYSI